MGKYPHLVVVDDERAIRDLCVDMLSGEGYEVSTARNGQEAVDLLAREPADLVLMDVTMPVMDGLAACKLIKANAQTRDIPVVFMTAATQTPERIVELKRIASGFVAKPFDCEELLDTVRQLVA